jgi:ribosomal protein S18 acetylase RimI-like enzyme
MGIMHLLDNPVWSALSGPQAGFGEFTGAAARFRPDVAPFAALADPDDPQSWADLAKLIGPDGLALLAGVAADAVPDGWQVTGRTPGVQLVATSELRAEPDPAEVPLGPADAAEMLALVELAKPGPFRERTVELGGYLGIRDGGRLVAMAGERFRPTGYAEISAVCTDPAYRGRGLAGRLVRAVAAGIVARGDTPCIQAAEANVGAIRLYQKLGFAYRRSIAFMATRPDPA